MRILALLTAALAANAWSQSMGTLTIEVKDSSGAAVAAKGVATSVDRGVTRSFETDAQGVGTISDLPFGRYRIQVSRDGFATGSTVVDLQSARESRSITLSIGAHQVSVDVVSMTPLPGDDRTPDQIPLPIQTGTDKELDASGSINLGDFLNKRFTSVFVNEVQGNPFQPDVNYRGYTASPLLGTPQGLSIYVDGVRVNQPFGDVVSWDLIPKAAIAETTLIPGSNPLFGLNTLGGALSVTTKDGNSNAGTFLTLGGGSFGRKNAEFDHGGSNKHGLSWYGAANMFFEDGWRFASPSDVRQFFGKLGWQGMKTVLGLSIAYANNALTGNGLQEQRLLAAHYSTVYTVPDETANKSPFLNFSFRHSPAASLSFSGNAYFRYIRTRTLNGDLNDDSLDQSVYQPSAAEIAALTKAGFSGFPTSGANATNTPFPKWRCIGQALLRDEPAEKCNGLLNRTNSEQSNYGVFGQASWTKSSGKLQNQLVVGGGFDGARVSFNQITELGYLNPDYSISGVGAFGDGMTGGNVDGKPFDTQVKLHGAIRTGSFYITDSLTVANKFTLTLGGRHNHTSVDNDDRLRPSGTGTLTSRSTFDRFNPAAGFTYRANSYLTPYFNYSEGNRAPTSIELGCADPNLPCKLPNALAGDPPLQQVVARTFEAGVRGGSSEGKLNWAFGWFRANNHDDLLFVASPQTGFGYFKNFGETRRQGIEGNVHSRISRVAFGGGYTFLRATYESSETIDGTGNSTNSLGRGLQGGTIQILPGNYIPLIPQHMLKAYLDLQATKKLSIDLDLLAVSGSYARGNENNNDRNDGVYYLGPGKTDPYGVLNLGAHYQVNRRFQLFVEINNLLNRKYYTAAQLGSAGITIAGSFLARPLPAINGEFPVTQSTFFAPGAPIGAWGGIKIRF